MSSQEQKSNRRAVERPGDEAARSASHGPHATFPQPMAMAVFLFLAALLPRLPGLGRFLTSDENTNIFFAGSDVIAAFLQGDLRGTYWHFYPGVTMSWLDAVGMAGQYWLDLLRGRPVPPFTEYIYSDILTLVVANRLPYALLTAAAVPLIYLLARKLLPEWVALLGALFVAFDPFYLAHSRVAHGDAPVAVFMSLSALAFFVYAKGSRSEAAGRDRQDFEAGTNQFGIFSSPVSVAHGVQPRLPFLIVSAIFGGLAALTKAPGQFMALFIVGMSITFGAVHIGRTPAASRSAPDIARVTTQWLKITAVWGIISLAIFVLLWPSMWVDPVGTFRQMWAETFGKVTDGHLVYFFGQPTLDPGPWFYFYVIPFRMTPVILIGCILSWLLFMPRRLRQDLDSNALRPVLALLWLFTLSLVLFANLSPKKQDRYLLPLFPILNLIAAVGWYSFFNLIYLALSSSIANYRISRTKLESLKTYLPIVMLLLFQLAPALSYYPYYLTYFNPLMGGPTRAATTSLMGWGEGMEQAAAYLNSKPKANSLYVASTPSQTLLPYFDGSGDNFYTNDIALRADYVVLYLAQMQRLAPSPEIVRYFEAQKPEATITIHGVVYAKIYPGPKLIMPDIPPDAIPANIGQADKIRLAGYKVGNLHSPASGLQITLYWHALAPLTADYTVSVRVHAAGGQLLAQHDSWPADGLLPTSQWRQGDYVTDRHVLEFTEAELGQAGHIEIVVYSRQTGETLGPPIILAMDHEQARSR